MPRDRRIDGVEPAIRLRRLVRDRSDEQGRLTTRASRSARRSARSPGHHPSRRTIAAVPWPMDGTRWTDASTGCPTRGQAAVVCRRGTAAVVVEAGDRVTVPRDLDDQVTVAVAAATDLRARTGEDPTDVVEIDGWQDPDVAQREIERASRGLGRGAPAEERIDGRVSQHDGSSAPAPSDLSRITGSPADHGAACSSGGSDSAVGRGRERAGDVAGRPVASPPSRESGHWGAWGRRRSSATTGRRSGRAPTSALVSH